MCGHCGCDQTVVSAKKIVDIEQDVLADNNRHAAANRSYFADNNILAINLVSSPGSGKTTLLEKSLTTLQARKPVAVIEGDQHTANDAERIRKTGVTVTQVNTGTLCHLDAHHITHALEDIKPLSNSLLFIENVGNLVCPAMFDLGEAHKVVLVSVTEGDDKPLKYPYMFRHSSLLLINKIDLLPYVDFNIDKCVEFAKRSNPKIEVLTISATQENGLTSWMEWLSNAGV